MNLRFVSFLVLLQLTALVATAEEKHLFSTWSVENGLPNNHITALLQDRTGFIWVGTRSGLSRMDGSYFLNFPLPFVRTLLELPDGRIWIGTSDGLYEWTPSSGGVAPLPVHTDAGDRMSGDVRRLRLCKDGSVVLATDAGLYRCLPPSETWTPLLFSPAEDHDADRVPTDIRDVLADRDGVLWLATGTGFLFRADLRRNRLTSFPIRTEERDSELLCLLDRDGDSLLMGCSEGGVWLFDKRTGAARPFIDSPEGSLTVLSLLPVGAEKIWIGTGSGLYVADTGTGTLTAFRPNLDDPTSLPDHTVTALFEDKEGGIWVGTRLGGVAYSSTEQNFIRLFFPSGAEGRFHGKVVRDMLEDADGRLWIATEDSGLHLYDRRNDRFSQRLPGGVSLPSQPISAMYLDGSRLVAGLFRHGLCILDTRTGRITSYSRKNGGPDTVLSLLKDARGDWWVGTQGGLLHFNPSAPETFSPVEGGPAAPVQDILESRSGRLWFATNGAGLWSLDPETVTWTAHVHEEGNPFSLSSDNVLSVMEDNREDLWIGTDGGGACRLDPQRGTFSRYGDTASPAGGDGRHGEAIGLPSETVYRILEDKLGNLWFTTAKGLSRFSPETGSYITYTHNYGAPSDQFNDHSALKTEDGTLYFGTVRGFMEVRPEELHTYYSPPPVVISSCTVGGEERILPVQNGGRKDRLSLRHDQTNISFRFSSLSYTAPQNNRYAWRLLDGDKDWNYTKSTSIQFTRLPPGNYLLEVRGANGDGVWNETPASLRIRVRPPFPTSPLGLTLEGLLLVSLLAWLLLRSRNRIREKNRQEILRIREVERDVAQKAKIDFFANIIHEIRTPLSLIKAPFDQIKRQPLSEEEYKENMDTIDANIDRLLQLSNEILDFSRIEKNAFSVHPKLTDVSHIAEEVLRRFSFPLQENRFSLEKHLPDHPVIVRIDPEILIKILTNLLSNAVKYADSRIVFTLDDSDPSRLVFRLSNDGPLILPENREKIFAAFWREDRENPASGTGLGLPLVRKLSELHGGTVSVDAEDTTLNTLVVELPVLPAEEPETEDVPDAEESSAEAGNPAERPTVVIVDDDAGIRTYLKRTLGARYNVLTCAGKKDLYDVLPQQLVDLIICDIMMPEVDGITLCNELKHSFEYSHIPVILLSAKADEEVRVKGLTANADAFVEKPFTLDLLEGQIENLFSRQQRLRNYFTRDPHFSFRMMADNPADQNLMDRIGEIILEHMEEEDFSIDRIADLLCMSRSSLYRKLRGITRLAPGELISTIRLKKAAELLSSGRFRVGEVAYLVGFKSVPYFSTSFRKQFGVSPKDFIKKERH